jgi:hypothetical protein
MRFVELGKPESGGELASPEPLDDVSFLYHVEPRIRASGLFGEDGKALVWLSNDERRLLLEMVAKISIATLTMELDSYTTAAASPGELE